MNEELFDAEAELERELAALDPGATPDGLWDELWDGQQEALPGASAGSATDTDDELESPTLQRYRDILHKREAFCDALEEDLRSVADQLTTATTVLHPTPDSGGKNRAAGWVGQWKQHASSLLQGDNSEDTAAVVSSLQAKVDTIAASMPQARPELHAAHRSAADQDGTSYHVSERMSERDAIAAEALAQQQAWEAERQRRQQEARRLEQEAHEAEEWAKAEAAAIEAQHAAAAARLEAEREAARKLHEEETARAAAELQRLEQERLAILQKQRQMDAEAADKAWLSIAARRIQRAWHSYLTSPAHAIKIKRVVTMQALWRGRAARKHTHLLRQQRQMLSHLEEAAAEGQRDTLRELATLARNMGLGELAMAKLSAVEQAALTAQERLTSAAATGTALTFTAAATAAQRYPHLAPVIESAQKQFKARQEAAEAALLAAVAGKPMQEVTRALEASAQLGTDAARLSTLLDEARRRDADLAAAMLAAASAPDLSSSGLEALFALAQALGLKGDVAAAKHVLDRRRRVMLANMAQLVSQDASASDLQGIMAEAQALGLDSEVQRLRARLHNLRASLKQEIEAVTSRGSLESLQALLARAEHAGLSQEDVAAATSRMTARQEAAGQDVVEQARTGALVAYKRARHEALVCGAHTWVEQAHRIFGMRREQASCALSAAFTALAHELARNDLRPKAQEATCRPAGLRVAEAMARAAGVPALAPTPHGTPAHSQKEARPSQRPAGRLVPASVSRMQASPELPPSVLQALGASPAPPVLQRAAQGAWSALVSALQLELGVGVRLALGALLLQGQVQAAQGIQDIAQTKAAVDHEGNLQLPGWPIQVNGCSATDSEPPPGTSLTDHTAVMAGRATDTSTSMHLIPLWPVQSSHQARLQHLRSAIVTDRSQQGSPGSISQHATSIAAALPHRRAPAAQGAARNRTTHGKGAGQALSFALVQAASGTVASSTAAGNTSNLGHVQRLDLGLEQLTSVSGLNRWCPSLTSLSANSNQLTSMAGLEGLSALTSLSLKDNQLSGLQGLGELPTLQHLALDSNELKMVAGLESASSLHTLSIADNYLTSFLTTTEDAAVGTRQSSPLTVCGPSLWELHASSNRLTDLRGLNPCTALTHLDVSRNQLHDLAGIQACVMLNHLDASHNCLEAWPAEVLAGMHHLRCLDLTSNSITALVTGQPAFQTAVHSSVTESVSPSSGAVLLLPPSLETLLLQDNQVSCIAQLQGAPALTRLDLSFNSIQDTRYLHALAPLSSLAQLQLSDNPVTSCEGYEAVLHAACPRLVELDGVCITQAQQAVHLAHAVTSSSMLTHSTRALLGGMVLQDVTGAVEAAAAARLAARTSTNDATSIASAVIGPLLELVAAVQVQSSVTQLTHTLWQPPAIATEQGRGADTAQWCATREDLFLCNTVQATLHSHSTSSCTAAWLRSQDHAARASACLNSPTSQPASTTPGTGVLQEAAGDPHSDALAEWHAQQLHLSHMSRFKQLAKSMRHVSLAGAPPSHAGSTASARDTAWPEYRRQHAQAQHDLQLQQLHEVQQLASRDAAAQPGVEQLTVHSSFFANREAMLSQHAARIQAAWRGHAARKHMQVLRSQQYMVRRIRAVTTIQAWWRGHRVRTSPELARQRQQHSAQREAARLLQEQARKAAEQLAAAQRESAAVILQAYVRARTVRRRFKAALQAARCGDDDDDDEYGGVGDDFLADIESLLERESIPVPTLAPHALMLDSRTKPQAAALAPADAPPAAQPLPTSGPVPGVFRDQLPALSRAFAAAAAKGKLPGGGAGAGRQVGGGAPAGGALNPQHLSPVAAHTNSSPPGLAPTTAWAAPASQPTQAIYDTTPLPPLNHPAATTRPPPVSIPSNLKAGPHDAYMPSTANGSNPMLGQYLEQQQGQYSDEEGGNDQGTPEPGSPSGTSYVPSTVISPTAQAEARAARQQRHLERMEKLMGEWGFKDLATAEAYWRRQQRQTQGNTRRRLEARFRDPAVRLKKLQDQVESRPKLRREDVQRQPHHGPEVLLHKGSLQGPPSRQQQQPTQPAPALAAEPSEASSAARSMGGRSHALQQQGRQPPGRAGRGGASHAWGTTHQPPPAEALAACEALLQGTSVGSGRSPAQQAGSQGSPAGVPAPVVYTRSSSLSATSPGHPGAWGLSQGMPSTQQQQQVQPSGARRGNIIGTGGAAGPGSSPPLLPDLGAHLRRPTALSDSAGPGLTAQHQHQRSYAAGSAGKGGSHSAAQVLVVSHVGDKAGASSGERTPPRSVGSAASEPALMPGSGPTEGVPLSPVAGAVPVGGAAAGLRKSLSVGHQQQQHKKLLEASRPVVLPQIGRAASSWVLSGSGGTSAQSPGKNTQGLSVAQCRPGTLAVQQLHLPPRGR